MGIANESWKTVRYNRSLQNEKHFLGDINRNTTKKKPSVIDIKRFNRKSSLLFRKRLRRMNISIAIALVATIYFAIIVGWLVYKYP